MTSRFMKIAYSGQDLLFDEISAKVSVNDFIEYSGVTLKYVSLHHAADKQNPTSFQLANEPLNRPESHSKIQHGQLLPYLKIKTQIVKEKLPGKSFYCSVGLIFLRWNVHNAGWTHYKYSYNMSCRNFNSASLGQNGTHFADVIFKDIFLSENIRLFNRNSSLLLSAQLKITQHWFQ